MNKDVKLPSGADLHITSSPFGISKALYQAVLEELKDLNLDPNTEIDPNFIKTIFCTGFSSKRVETALAECMKRVTYNGVKVTDDTFEPDSAREDYTSVCLEVALVNILPFFKNLSQLLNRIVENTGTLRKQK